MHPYAWNGDAASHAPSKIQMEVYLGQHYTYGPHCHCDGLEVCGTPDLCAADMHMRLDTRAAFPTLAAAKAWVAAENALLLRIRRERQLAVPMKLTIHSKYSHECTGCTIEVQCPKQGCTQQRRTVISVACEVCLCVTRHSLPAVETRDRLFLSPAGAATLQAAKVYAMRDYRSATARGL